MTQYTIGQPVQILAGGKWWPGKITKAPHPETQNYGVRFRAGTRTINTVASPDQLKPAA